MEFKTKNLLIAKKEGDEFLNKFKNNKKEDILQKAMDIDNTNSSILFYYLKEPSNMDKISLYKDFLNKGACKNLNIEYSDHKSCVISVLKSIEDIKVDNLNIESLKISLEKNIPRDQLKKYNLEREKTINNMPFDIKKENLLYLAIKLLLGEKLYPIIDNKINEDEYKEIYTQNKKECLSYIKVISEIMLYYIENNKNEQVYNLINIIEFNEEINNETSSKIVYYLNHINKDINEVEKRTGYPFKKYKILEVPKCPDDLATFKNEFFDLIEKILKRNCINDLLTKLKSHHNDKYDIVKIDEDFIQYIKKNTIFCEFFKSKDFGITNFRELKTFINIDFRNATLKQNNIDYLFNFCIWIVTALLEYIGYLLKDYYYYSSNFTISHNSLKKKNEKKIKKIEEKEEEEDEEEKEEEEEKKEEGGFLVEKLLFKGINRLYLCDMLYILNIKNWEKNMDEFSHFFISKERQKFIKGIKKIRTSKLDEEFSKFIKKFNVSKEELAVVKPNTSIECKTSISPLYYIDINITSGCRTHKKYNLF